MRFHEELATFRVYVDWGKGKLVLWPSCKPTYPPRMYRTGLWAK